MKTTASPPISRAAIAVSARGHAGRAASSITPPGTSGAESSPIDSQAHRVGLRAQAVEAPPPPCSNRPVQPSSPEPRRVVAITVDLELSFARDAADVRASAAALLAALAQRQ